MRTLFLLLVLFLGYSTCKHQLAVYWGQDSAGSFKLTKEEGLLKYCQDFNYDIIPIAFLDIFFDSRNKDEYPGMNLADHCKATFQGYPSLLHCPEIAQDIAQCQQLGKKILISLGGSAGMYQFTSPAKAATFASTIWNLFLGGSSNVRPFSNVVLDGVDLDIESGSTNFYADFLRSLKQYMSTDTDKQYYISGAPQCPYPDAIMGPVNKGAVLTEVPFAFDYLFVQFYNNYCYLGEPTEFSKSIQHWLKFAADTKEKYNGKGPSIFIGIPSHSKASSGSKYYRTPEQIKAVYNVYKNEENFGGFMLWDASFDLNNKIDGKYFSEIISSFLLKSDPKVKDAKTEKYAKVLLDGMEFAFELAKNREE